MSAVAKVESLAPGPIVGVAMHCANLVSAQLAALLSVSGADRLREEDPYTDLWTSACDVRVCALHSRFEVDLNRPRERAVYRSAADAWGLEPWRREPHTEILARSLALYDAFYAGLRTLLDDVAKRCGRFVVLDMHSYNHRRGGAAAPSADARANPVLNLGTGHIDREYWAPLLDPFAAKLASAVLLGRPLDVRENVRFKGGHLTRWVNANYPSIGCSITLEWKKVYMDEWTGVADPATVAEVGAALATAIPTLREGLRDSFPLAKD